MFSFSINKTFFDEFYTRVELFFNILHIILNLHSRSSIQLELGSTFKTPVNADLEEFNGFDEDIKLPTLPSEIGRNAESLPVPKHLASDSLFLESNSDDEGSNSSSSGQL